MKKVFIITIVVISGAILFVCSKTYSQETISIQNKVLNFTVASSNNIQEGDIDGKIDNTMDAMAWSRNTDNMPEKENFQSTRTGKYDDECRDQTSAEKKVINNAVSIFENTFLQPLQKMNWQITDEKNGTISLISVNPNPFRPLFFCSDFFDLELTLDPDSPSGKMLQDSATYYNDQVTKYSQNIMNLSANDDKAYKQAYRNLYHVQEAGRAEISIDANDPYIKQDWLLDSKDRHTVLHIPGAAYAWQLYEPPTDDSQSPVEKTMLYFGNWKGINMFTGTYEVYPFIHKQQSPFIENFVVTIIAQASVANEIIKNIDWSKLNAAIIK